MYIMNEGFQRAAARREDVAMRLPYTLQPLANRLHNDIVKALELSAWRECDAAIAEIAKIDAAIGALDEYADEVRRFAGRRLGGGDGARLALKCCDVIRSARGAIRRLAANADALGVE